MKKELYTGNDAPVSLSITRLLQGYAVIICLCATVKEVETNEEYPEGKEYSYTKISGMMDDVSLNSIISTVQQADSLMAIDADFIHALQSRYNDFSRSRLISAIVRSRYTADDVEAILLNHGDGSAKHQQEYHDLQVWRATAKEVASIAYKD